MASTISRASLMQLSLTSIWKASPPPRRSCSSIHSASGTRRMSLPGSCVTEGKMSLCSVEPASYEDDSWMAHSPPSPCRSPAGQILTPEAVRWCLRVAGITAP